MPPLNGRPTRESFHLGVARAAYAQGLLTLEELERSVEHVLRGGTLTQTGEPYRTPFDAPAMESVPG